VITAKAERRTQPLGFLFGHLTIAAVDMRNLVGIEKMIYLNIIQQLNSFSLTPA